MNKKRVAGVIAAMAMTAVVAVGGTMAYLQSVTETKKNTFSSHKGISTDLTETEWNEDEASNYIPGQVIAKNPVMHNETNGENATDILVGVIVDYKNGDGNSIDYNAFKSYATTLTKGVEGKSTSWELVASTSDGSEFYVYKTKLASGGSTEPIFDHIQVNAGIKRVMKSTYETTKIYKVDENGNKILVDDNTTVTEDTQYYVKDENGEFVLTDIFELPTFSIDVTGFAIQAEGFIDGEGSPTVAGKNQLINLANSKLNLSLPTIETY